MPQKQKLSIEKKIELIQDYLKGRIFSISPNSSPQPESGWGLLGLLGLIKIAGYSPAIISQRD